MAVPKDQLKQLVRQIDYYDSDLHVNSFLIGGDFLATTIRAWPQFFFGIVLPLPILQAVSFLIAGGLWAKRARDYRITTVLTDEFILAYLALNDILNELNDDEKAKLKVIGDEIDRLENAEEAELIKQKSLNQQIDQNEKTRIKKLKDFFAVEGNKKKILDELAKANDAGDGNDPEKWSKRWAFTYNVAFQYATAYWVLWMMGTLALYSAKDFEDWHNVEYTYASDPGSAPGVFENETWAWLQFVLPALLIIGAVAYNKYYEEEKNKQADFTQKLVNVRADYLVRKPEEAVKESENSKQFSEGWVVGLTMGAAFVSAFLVGYLTASPITAALNYYAGFDKAGDNGTENAIKIWSVFGAVMILCATQLYFKYQGMKKEYKDAGNDAAGYKLSNTWQTKQTFVEFYRENPRIFWNTVLDRLSGSGGILFCRFVFNGGPGGYIWDKKNTDGMDHIKEVMPFAVTAMAIMILLNLAQTYYAAQREAQLKGQHDVKLAEQVKPKPSVK